VDLDADMIEELEELDMPVSQVGANPEFCITVAGDVFDVYQGSDVLGDPDGWYVELVPRGVEGSEEYGPYDSAEAAIQDVFIDQNI
jgi:hypothetical protein